MHKGRVLHQSLFIGDFCNLGCQSVIMQYRVLVTAFLLVSTGLFAQDVVPDEAAGRFTAVVDLAETPIQNQHRTGTCWSFSTASFFESEMIRQGLEPVNLSEMYIVRHVYLDKVDNYIRRQGKAQLGEGGLSHDLLQAFARHGIMPEDAYTGLPAGASMHNHGELESAIRALASLYADTEETSPYWHKAIEAILDVYLGELPDTFYWQGSNYTPQTFAEKVVPLNPADYIEISSFSHHPFYTPFVLEVPDNYSNGIYYNVPLEDLMAITYHALKNGFSIAWDGDVSESGFVAREGLAVLPANQRGAEASSLDNLDGLRELEVDQQLRQQAFDRKETTDDHLMHITGLVEDPHGNQYFTVKNSWGAIGPFDGFLYMSDAYYRMKTVGIMVHRDAIPRSIATKLGL